MGKKTLEGPDQDARQKAKVDRRRVGHDQQNTVQQKSHDLGETPAGSDPLGTKRKQALHSFISSSVCGLHAGFSAPSRRTTSWMTGGFFLGGGGVFFWFKSMFGGVGNVASHLGWTGCLESGKEVGAGEATTTQVLMEKRGVGVMEGAFQRYTE